MTLLEKEFKKANFRNIFLDLELKEVNSERFSSLTTLAADSSTNTTFNRYYNVLPYDHSRVKLNYNRQEIYINANYVRVPEADREYVLTQGPLEATVDHFWLMCQQVKTTCIVMLCRCYENSRDKSAKYWPSAVGESLRFNYGLEVELLEETETNSFVIRDLRLTDTSTSTSRDIKHFHYVNWPDFNVPDSPDSFLDFLQIVQDTGCFETDVGPPVVHCSAGIGRSGTFCLVDSCLVLAGLGKELSLQCIRTVLLNMRTQRMGLIQTEDQLRFSVSSIISGRSRVHTNGTTKPKMVTNEEGGEQGGWASRFNAGVKGITPVVPAALVCTERMSGKRMSGSQDTTPPSSKKQKSSES